jgi:hypothetical protein
MQDADYATGNVNSVQIKLASHCVILEASREIELAFFSTDTGFALQK